MRKRNKKDSLPNIANYPANSKRKWNEIPMGLALNDENRREEAFIDVQVAPHMLIMGGAASGKSVVQRNIINHCVQYPDHWRFYGVDLKRVELSPYGDYAPVVETLATTLPDVAMLLIRANQEMQERYTLMEEQGVNNFMELSTLPHAMMIMFDEANDALSPIRGNSIEAQEENDVRKLMRLAVQDIARLGRAAGIHLVLTSANPKFLESEEFIKENFPNRIVVGKVDAGVSQLVLSNDKGTAIAVNRGRAYIQAYGMGKEVQTYYAPQKWAGRYLEGDTVWLNHWEKTGEDLDTVNAGDDSLNIAAYANNKEVSWNRISLDIKKGNKGSEVLNLDLERNLHVWITGQVDNSGIRTQIIDHCVQHQEYWRVKYINLKDDGTSDRIPAFVDVAGTMVDAIDVLRLALVQGQEKAANSGTVNYGNNAEPTLLIFIDEATLLFNENTEVEELRAEAVRLVGEVVNLGRFANSRIIMATDGKDYLRLPYSTLGGFGVRISVDSDKEGQ